MAGQALLEQGIRRRADILRFSRAYIKEHGYGPSLREIAAGVGCSRTPVTTHLQKLEEEGKITMDKGRYRSMRVI